jgi:lysophospholipase L1-like esterase
VLGTGLTLLSLEIGARVLGPRLGFPRSRVWELRGYVLGGQTRFAPRAYKGWVFTPGEREINAEGFLDRPHEVAKRPGVLRIACLGGSTTAGNLEQGQDTTYPAQLERLLMERSAVEVEVLNLGVAGWTTAETLANWFLHAQDYAPDVVVLHHAVNDALPRLRRDFRSDYTHFRVPWRGEPTGPVERFLTRWSDLYCLLRLRTWEFDLLEHVVSEKDAGLLEPAPGSADAFVRNVRTVLDHARDVLGARVVVLTMPWSPERATTPLEKALVQIVDEHDELLRALSAERGYTLLDLARDADAQLCAEFLDPIHFTPEGRARKARYVADGLLAAGLVPAR